MKKHDVQCPHCFRQFEFVPPRKINLAKSENQAYKKCVEFWLLDFHPGWAFGGVQGKALKEILKKLETAIKKDKNKVYSDEILVDYFALFCWHLPEYFMDKDLQKLNSSYNEIIEQLKRGRNGSSKQWHSKNSHDRFNEVNSRFKD